MLLTLNCQHLNTKWIVFLMLLPLKHILHYIVDIETRDHYIINITKVETKPSLPCEHCIHYIVNVTNSEARNSPHFLCCQH